MRPSDLGGDVEPQPDPRSLAVLAARKRLKQTVQNCRRDGWAAIRDREPEDPIQDLGLDPHLGTRRAMGDGVAHEVREKLAHARPVAVQSVDDEVGADATMRYGLDLGHHLFELRSKIGRRIAIDGQATGQAAFRQIQ